MNSIIIIIDGIKKEDLKLLINTFQTWIRSLITLLDFQNIYRQWLPNRICIPVNFNIRLVVK